MAEAETIYSARAVRERLGISDGMLRRYAIALEQVTGEPIRQHPRDGRQYTADQVAALERAKLRVAEKRGRDVETAIRLALGQSEVDAEAAMLPESSPGAAMIDPRAFTAALEPVLQPLLAELQALRESNERLHAEVVGLRQDAKERVTPAFQDAEREPQVDAPQVASQGDTASAQGGALVRAAARLERLIRRVSGRQLDDASSRLDDGSSR